MRSRCCAEAKLAPPRFRNHILAVQSGSGQRAGIACSEYVACICAPPKAVIADCATLIACGSFEMTNGFGGVFADEVNAPTRQTAVTIATRSRFIPHSARIFSLVSRRIGSGRHKCPQLK